MSTKVIKKKQECSKTCFKASEESILHVTWKRYVLLTQNSPQSAQKSAAIAVKPASKPSKKRLCLYLGKNTFVQHKIATEMLKLNPTIVVKPISKRAKYVSACVLITIRPIDAKQPPKCSKKSEECYNTGFKAREETFQLVFLQQYIVLTQNGQQSAQKRALNTLKPVSKP